MNLKNILIEKAKQYSDKQNLSIKEERESAIIFGKLEDSFIKESFDAIEKNPAWKERIDKTHSHFKGESVKEMQSSNSSDALLMNIFCYPKLFKWKGVRDLFLENKIEIDDRKIDFGCKPNVSKGKEQEKTEIDMVIGNTFFEAKLTESDFTSKEIEKVEKYDCLYGVFDKDKLPKHKTDKNKYESYQIIRNFLAAHQGKKQHRLLCDERRGDLVRAYYEIVGAIKIDDFKEKVGVIFWQEIAKKCGEPLKTFLLEKYGLC
ncbi:MAG: hypothetical protein K0U66_01715 [Gammaproteobacteria bacterium]|nr:hypothetical protein [Gammaproteobacteria bacterium]